MKENIYFLYQRFLNNSCTEEELTYLFEKFAVADEGALKQLINEELSGNVNELPASPEEAALIRNVRQRVEAEIKIVQRPLKSLIYKLATTAAILAFIVCALVLFQNPAKTKRTLTSVQVAAIVPGSQQATLTLSNGKKVLLSKTTSGVLATLGRTAVLVSPGKGVSFSANNIVRIIDTSANTLTTNRGQQSPYPLVLADGSKVWLNAASSITFPTQFGADQRVVKVTGEAYFEVAHNKAVPFKVITDKQEIVVLGTHFNIKSYADDNIVSTTLLEGSVKVKTLSSKSYSFLSPGQQSKINKSNGQLTVSNANIEEVIAWKNGFFMFDNQKITSIMKSMSRWYDVEVEYKNFTNNEKFGGTFSRSSNLNDILNSLQSLGKIRFKTVSKKIIVSN